MALTLSSPVQPTDLGEYRRLEETAGLFTASMAVLSLRGKDSLDLLQRITTNDLLDLPFGAARPTVFVTEKGRIVALAFVVRLSDRLLLIADTPDHGTFCQWIERFIIMEDVVFTDITGQFHTMYYLGAHAGEAVLSGFQTVGGAAHASETVWERADGSGYAIRDPRWSFPCFIILGEKTDTTGKRSMDLPGFPMTTGTFETLRIENGVPKFGAEISDQFNPLEAGLVSMVSFTKGCYIGQEVIARLDTYKKVKQRLSGLIFEGEESVMLPGKLFKGTMEVDAPTSLCFSPILGQYIGLGFLPTAIETTTLTYIPTSSTGHDQRVVNIVELPFRNALRQISKPR